jgi:hypothetical protein
MPDRSKSTMRSLGEFFGHIVKGVRTQPEKPRRTVVRQEVQEETRDGGRVKLRRTITEEVEIDPPARKVGPADRSTK